MNKFVNLHVHTHYSLFDGIGMPEDFAKKAASQGSPGIAITDHGGLYGAIELYKAAKENGIAGVIGCEMYLAFNSRTDKRPNIDNRRYHLILLAENHQGYQNLLKLVTLANLEGMYYKPRIDWELLEKYHDGLIATSTCLQGEIPQAIAAGDKQKTAELIQKYQRVFGPNNFFLELQDHPTLPEQGKLNEVLIDLSKQYKVPLLATNDSHYVNIDDADAQDAMLCIQMNSTLEEPGRLCMKGADYSLRGPDEMEKVFAHVPEAIENTWKIAERCHYDFEFGKYLIPSFPISAVGAHFLPLDKGECPPQADEGVVPLLPIDYLRELCYEGLKKKYHLTDEDVQARQNGATPLLDRLEYELKVIEQMGFANYFLIVWDFVKWAKDQGIVVGPGRGSAAGAIVSYTLDITTIDPIRYGLLFERFLNPERISMPDIDLDFADNRRDEVLNYVRNKYGEERFAQISTFGTMTARAVVKDVGRVMGIPFVEMNEFSKLILERPGTTLQEAIAQSAELRQAIDTSPKFQKLMQVALKLEGSVRHVSVHACAVVIADKPLTTYTALQRPPKEDQGVITQYSAKPIEALGLLKMDFLGLKNLTILQTALRVIERTKNKKIELADIPMDDKKTYALLSRGETTGVFQLESGGMKRYLKELRPTEFEDIIAMVSLYRPGPMEWIKDYIAGKHKRKKIEYQHPSLAPILQGTFGIAIYQEQILQIAQAFGGFTLGEADLLRRAIGKKIVKELEAQRDKFIQGAVKKGHKESLAIQIFDKVVEPFAGYGFNKSHGAAYAMIAYHTAYLKAHYPTEFMTALMSSDSENMDRIVLEIEESEQMGIEVLPPDVNESLSNFTVVKDGTIRFGLSAIKGLGDGSVKAIIDAREQTGEKFKSLEDFAKRVPQKILNKKSIESLALSGAMDALGERNQIALNYENMAQFSKSFQNNHHVGQQDLFGMLSVEDSQGADGLKLEKIEPATESQRLGWEKEYLGLYVSSHPLAGLSAWFRKKVIPLDTLPERTVGQNIRVAGLITGFRKVNTKKGDVMAIITLEDPFGKVDAVAFPSAYQKFVSLWETEGIFFMEGKLEKRMGQFQISIETVKKMPLDEIQAEAKKEKLWIKDEKLKHQTRLELQEEELQEASHVFEPEGVAAVAEVSLTGKKHQIIALPNVQKEFFVKLRELLEKYPGKEAIELLIGDRIMPLPLTITMTPELGAEIDALVKKG